MRFESLIFGLVLLGVVFIVIVPMGLNLIGDWTAGQECKQKYPSEEFCKYVEEGIECGTSCKDLGLEFFYFDRGGIFANDKCSCIDYINQEVKQLY